VSAPGGRLLVVDASLNKRLATELNRRGRLAISASELELRHAEDPELLAALQRDHPDCVLITADDDMPFRHRQVIEELRPTIATVEPVRGGFHEDARRCEIVHRWAHAMELQQSETIRRYTPSGHRLWTARRRRP
jgi:PHD/YefM family antitoxin component YafN of YafNO toxin-antitoxin module